MDTARRGIRVLAALLGLAAFGAVAPLGAQEAGAALRGRVLDERGAPLSGAAVKVLSEGRRVGEVVADGSGRFELAGLAAGRYLVRVEAMGWWADERLVEVGPGGADVELRLAPAPVEVAGLVVTAARTSAPVATIPGSVTVLERERVEEQAVLFPGMAGVLSQLVPGLSAGTQSLSSYGQSFRGRNVAVLIDGVPQSTSRNVLRDFSTIDPALVERVEVLRGATAVYGDGATGGVINIVTRGARAGGPRFTTSLGLETSGSDAGDGTGLRVAQTVAARRGALDFLFSGALASTGSFFDAEGDRIPSDPHGQGGVADFRSWSFLSKVGAESGVRRLELTVSRFDGSQDTEYASDPAVNAADPGTEKARALPGLDLSERQGSENLNVLLGYRDGAFLGGQLRAQLFHRDYVTRFGPWDGRRYIGVVAQSFVDSEKTGARIEFERALPLATAPTVVAGVDFTDEATFQGVGVMDPAAYDSSGGLVFRKVGEDVWVPPIDTRSLGLFAQFGWSPLERLSVRGGVRHELVRLSVDDFETITGNAVSGGELEYRPVLFNLGAVVSASEVVGVFASYSQGFSLTDVGRVLRGVPAGYSLGSKQLEAQLVDHYEAGVRAEFERARLTGSVFYNESELGTILDQQLNVVRAPERVYGFEASADVRVAPSLDAGGTYTWTEGEIWFEKDGEYKALNGYRIQPPKLTLWGEHRFSERWSNRVQLLWSGDRDRAFRDQVGYGQNRIESYAVVDWLSRLRLGRGTLDVGVHNLLDSFYFPVVSQLMLSGNASRAAGRGRTLSVGYTVSY